MNGLNPGDAMTIGIIIGGIITNATWLIGSWLDWR